MQYTSDRQMNSNNILNNALKGAVAGAIAVWAMDRLDWFIFEHEDPQARHRTESVRPDGLDPAHVVASRAAHAIGTELHPSQPHPAGIATHYALGIGPAAIYGALRERLLVTSQNQDFLYGLGLGLGLFLVQDEGLNQVMGLSGKQKDYPWQAHARGLAAHLTFGLVTNLALNLLKAPRPLPRQTVRFDDSMQWDSDFVPMASAYTADEARTGSH
jgi:hypothetical protein